MCARRHQQMAQFVCDGAPEQRPGVRARLLGQPVDAIDVDRREHTSPRLRVEHRVAEWEHAARSIGRAVGADDSDCEFSRSERRLAGTRAPRVGWRRGPGAGFPDQVHRRGGHDRCGDCERRASLGIGCTGAVVDSDGDFCEERRRRERRQL